MSHILENKRQLEDQTISEGLVNKKQKVEELEKKKGTSEPDVGITEFLCHKDSNTRITGTLKQRYTDFLVNEIDVNGNVVHLLDLGFKPKELTEEEKLDLEKKKEEVTLQDKKPIDVKEEYKRKLVEYFGEENTQDILSLINDGGKTIEIDKIFEDKEERTAIHKLIREAFNNKLEGVTTSGNTFKFGLNANYNRRNNRYKNVQSPIDHNLGPKKNFLHFVLYKENKETMEVASLLSKILNIPVKWVKYAGTKDRRGVTAQKASIEKLSVERVTPLNKTLKGCKIGGFTYENHPINLGDLQGNEFIITIRDAQSTNPDLTVEEAVKPILKSLSEIGFINYFGMQRFGTFTISTHEIGKEILKSNWKKAGELILSEQEIVIPGSVESRQIWKETRDAAKALKKMPRKCNAEFSILSRLDRAEKDADGEYNENAYFNAIMGIPRNLRIMYGHAYQSYIWNVVASLRIKLFGLTVVAGDLVLISNEKCLEDEENKVKVDDDGIVEDVKKTPGLKARPITQQEVDAKRFDIYDVVLPTPGFDVIYPENEALKNLYVDTMGKDGLDPFNMSRKVREFSLSGSYRHVVAKVKNLEYHIRKYKNPSDTLVRTDLEILQYRERRAKNGDENAEIIQILDDIPDGDKTALILKLQLGVSTYATMALRELIDGDTSRFGGVVGLQANKE